ncbi:MAG: tungsten ABC transporter substrate-binding protein [endosymbiont of Galathealinum brachiosum]|uniref:Tungsten ABC transporter substrate-binding protein n=1 Tax=endosymbiont of Galathealinum brachiosum TaxID=2200906 RepID=A0A370DDM3_9GAMM|nr:MAG: tungsten ABC transporter substrate-binding protein [endosymbiont of Galathealinum brachiosum]
MNHDKKIVIRLIKSLCVIVSLLYSAISISDELVLAVASSTKSSGLIGKLIPVYEKHSGNNIKLYSVASGKALKMGRRGEVDLVMVHAPEAELKFIKDGYGVDHTKLMKNEFLIVGPADDPARIDGMNDVQQAFKHIHERNSLFISRADDSGTHNKESGIWLMSNIEPYGDWYYEFGGNMKDTLLIADEKQGYVMVDSATWLKMRHRVSLQVYVKGDSMLDNIYSVIAINPERYRRPTSKHAKGFIDWIKSEDGLRIIRDLTIDNEKLYTLLQK